MAFSSTCPPRWGHQIWTKESLWNVKCLNNEHKKGGILKIVNGQIYLQCRFGCRLKQVDDNEFNRRLAKC